MKSSILEEVGEYNEFTSNGSQRMVLGKWFNKWFKEWFLANKLSLNVGKTKFSLFHKSGKKYSIPSHLPTLKINNHDIERINTMKFLGVLLDDNLSWKEHIKYLENKIAKNIGLMYRAKPFLDKESL